MEGNTTRRAPTKLLEVHSTLWVVWWCGLASILVDIDHAISLLLWRYYIPEISEGRIFHTPLFLSSGLVICYLGTHLTGLYPKLVLIGVLLVTILVLVFSPLVVWSW